MRHSKLLLIWLVLVCLLASFVKTDDEIEISDEDDQEEDDDDEEEVDEYAELMKKYFGEDPSLDASFRFINERLLEYIDPSSDQTTRIKVPAFLSGLSASRIVREAQEYVTSTSTPKRLSQRLVLESLYYSLNFGADKEPQPPPLVSCLQGAKGWLDESIDFCEWEYVTCHNIQPRPQDRPRVEFKLLKKEQLPLSKPYDWGGGGDEDLWPAANIVTKLDFAGLGCTGSIPEFLGELKQLHRLDLRGNQLQGTLPDSLGQLESLQFLDISHNQNIRGTLPTTLALLTNLKELWLNENQLSGTIHTSYGSSLKRLKYLDLSQNSFTGTILEDLELTYLEGLFLESNQLTGSLSTELSKLKRLKYLNLSSNQFQGSIPRKWCQNLGKLRYLFLTDNQIKGTLPGSMHRLSSLVKLKLSSNQLSGAIFSDRIKWKELSQLKELAIDHNTMTGFLHPAFARAMTSLTR